MPNHVHIVFSLGATASGDTIQLNENVNPFPVTRLMASIKKYTARKANKLLGREGSFWQHESYDHVIRNPDELERIIWYVLNNPVAAGLTNHWTEWEWTYCKPGILLLDTQGERLR
jgi:REP element-mobilizing transposase RayT